MTEESKSISGCLLGGAVGDALGLPYEGVGPQRVPRLFGGPCQHHLLPGRGMVSDDTEHAIMVAQCLVESGDDVARYTRKLGWRMRLWFLGLPAGIGLATLRACLKLMIGFPPTRSGVWSAGNGPAMRAPLLGVVFGSEPDKLLAFVEATTHITHRDPKAVQSALAVAVAAYLSQLPDTPNGTAFLSLLREYEIMRDSELLLALEEVVRSVGNDEPTIEYLQRTGLGKGVTGYSLHTVPAVVHAWLSTPEDYRTALLNIIHCGGDTDTTGAILGGIVGARGAAIDIPQNWIDGIIEFPRSVRFILRLSDQLTRHRQCQTTGRALHLSVTGIAIRNMLFTLIVLTHGFRRMLPPY